MILCEESAGYLNMTSVKIVKTCFSTVLNLGP